MNKWAIDGINNQAQKRQKKSAKKFIRCLQEKSVYRKNLVTIEKTLALAKLRKSCSCELAGLIIFEVIRKKKQKGLNTWLVAFVFWVPFRSTTITWKKYKDIIKRRSFSGWGAQPMFRPNLVEWIHRCCSTQNPWSKTALFAKLKFETLSKTWLKHSQILCKIVEYPFCKKNLNCRTKKQSFQRKLNYSRTLNTKEVKLFNRILACTWLKTNPKHSRLHWLKRRWVQSWMH